jgi:hypothetical protein
MIRHIKFWIAVSFCILCIALMTWVYPTWKAIRVVSAGSQVTWNESALSRLLKYFSSSISPLGIPESINMQNVPNDTEEFVRALGQLPNTLRSATISMGNDPVAPLVVNKIIRMNGLSTLKVYGCTISDSSLAKLTELPNLRSLALSSNEQSFHKFSPRSHVEILELEATKLDQEGLRCVLNVQTLKELSIVDNTLDFDSLLSVNWRNPSLAGLVLGYVGEVTSDQIRALVDTIKKGCPKIEEIYLNNQNVLH